MGTLRRQYTLRCDVLSFLFLTSPVGLQGAFLVSPEPWGSAPEDWERSVASYHRHIECTVAQVRAAGWGDACAGEAVRDVLENIEICSINVELLNRTGSFDDPAWIERRSLAARNRLEATTNPVLLPGYRKIVRKWNEEIMRFQMTSA
jgi:hypothetical protein